MGQEQAREVKDDTPLVDEVKEFPLLEVPMDPNDNDYCVSFTHDQKDEYSQYGFVVIRDVVSAENVQQTLDEIWHEAETQNQLKAPFKDLPPVSRDDPTTWTSEHGWPGAQSVGIFGHTVCSDKMSIVNRLNPIAYDVFKTLLGEEKLWTSFDRFGVMKPTKNVLLKDGQRRDFPEYKTRENWLHWDMNPFKTMGQVTEQLHDGGDSAKTTNDLQDNYFICERNGCVGGYKKMQGMIAITDARKCDGGFLTIPGFTNHLHDWCVFHENTVMGSKVSKRADFVNVPEEDPLNKQAQPVPIRAGSLLVWDSRQPHCNFPNESDRFRMVQYIKMFPARNEHDPNYEKFVEARKTKILEYVRQHSDLKLGELENKLLGIVSWF